MSASVSAEEALFKAVLERPMAQRNSYLKRTCGDDSDLRRRVEERLAARDMCGGSTSQQPEGERRTRKRCIWNMTPSQFMSRLIVTGC